MPCFLFNILMVLRRCFCACRLDSLLKSLVTGHWSLVTGLFTVYALRFTVV